MNLKQSEVDEILSKLKGSIKTKKGYISKKAFLLAKDMGLI